MATNRDLAMVNAAIKQQNTMQTRIAKMQQGAMYANNTAESLLKGAKKAGYTIPASAYQQAVQNIQNTQQTAQQSGGITAESLMNEYQQWLGQQSNQAKTSSDSSSGGYAGAGYQQYLQNNQQIPSLNSMSNEDLAKQINFAEMVKNQTAQSQEEQDKNVTDILAKLNSDSSMADKAKQLINQRNTDYTNLTGKTDYDDAVQRTLQTAIPSLTDARKTTQPTQSGTNYSNEDIAKIIAQASGNDEADILNQLNSSPELVEQAKTMLAQRDSDYAALMQQDAQNAADTQLNSATAKPTTTKAYNAATAEYKKAQTATAEAKKKVEAAQKKLDEREKKIQSLEKSLEKAKKTAQKTGHYEQVNAIQQQIRGMQDTSADNEAFKKATDAYNKAQREEQAKRLKQANQVLLNPTSNKKDQEQAQTAIAAPNGTFSQSGEDFTTTSGKGGVTYNDDGTVTMRHGNDTRTTKNGVIPSLLAGFGNGFTDMGQKITKTVARAFGTPEAVDAERNLTEAQNVQKKVSESNPKSYMAGNVAGTMLNTAIMYNMANAIGDNMGATDAAKSVIQKAIPSLSGKALDTAANIMVGQAADTLLDTTPTAIEAYQNGASPTELANTIAENQIQNLAGNFVGEGISAAADKLKAFLKANGNTAEDAVSNIAKNANLQARPDIQYQSPEDASKEFSDLMKANADTVSANSVKTQSAEEADAEARQLLSQYLNGEGAQKDRRNNAVSSFMRKAENTPVSDEEVGSIIKAAQQNQVNSGERALSDAINKRAVTAASLDNTATDFPTRYRNRQKLTANDDDIRSAVAKIKQARPDLAENVDSLVKEAFPDIEIDGNTKYYRDVPDSGIVGDTEDVLGDYRPRTMTTKTGRQKGSDTYDANMSMPNLAAKIDNFEKKYGVADDTVKGYLDKAKMAYNDIEDAVRNGRVGVAEEAVDNYKQALSDLSSYAKKNIDGFDPKDLSARSYGRSADNILEYQSRRTRYTKSDLMDGADEAVEQAPKNDKVPSIADNAAQESGYDWYSSLSESEKARLFPTFSDEETSRNIRKYFGRDEEVPSLKKNKVMAESTGNKSVSTTSKLPEVEVDVKGYNTGKAGGSSNKGGSVKQTADNSFNDAYSDESWDALVKEVNGGGSGAEPPKYKRTNTEYKMKETNPSDAVKRVRDRMDSRPNTVDNEGYIGKEYTNTIKNSGLATKEQYEKGLEEQTRHFTQTEKQSFDIGKRMYDSNPEYFVNTYSARMDKNQLRSLGASDLDAMHIAYGNLNQAAKNATDPAEAATLRRQASNIARNLTDAQHYNGQALQASAKWKGTADGAIMSVDGTLQRLRENALSPKQHDQIDDAAQKIADMLRDMVDGKGSVDSKNQLAWQQVKDALDGYSGLKGKLSDKQIKNFTDSVLKDKDWNGIQDLLEIEMTGYSDLPADVLDEATKLFDEAQKYNFNSRNYMDLETKAYKVLSDGIQNQNGWRGASFGQKVDSWRYLMMLGNPKTMIKNEVGNKLFGSITEAKDDVGSIIEASVDRINKATGGNGIDRTKTLLNRFSDSDQNLISAAKEYGENNAARALSGNKYLQPGEALNRSFDTFGDSAAGRALQKMSDTVGDILDNADQKAMMEKYQHAMARYVKANGYDVSIFKDGSEEAKQFLENASAYAVHQAEEAAFHQDSGFSSALTRFVNSMKGGNAAEKVIGNAVDATIPFKKTPTNVLKSALEYSPLEYGSALLNTRKLVRGEIKPSEYIDMISKATTGSVMLGVGALLANEGIVQIGSNKGTQESNTDTRTGLQGSSLNFNIGGKSISVGLGDLTPASSPFIMGATLYESIGKKRGIDAFMSGLTNVADGLIDMSMLQGISGLLESQRYADDDELPIATLGKEVVSNYAGQFLPSLGRAVNSTVNSTATSSYSDKEGFQKFVEQQGKYLETKIPGLQQIGKVAKEKDIPVLKNLNLEPAIDAWGNEKKNNAMGLEGVTDNKTANAAGRGVANFLSPTKVTADTSEEVDNKIRELKNNLVDSGQMSDEDADELFPYTASSEAKIGDGKLSPSDWTTYQKEKGKLSHELATELLTSGKYDDMDDLSKAETLTELYKFAKNYESAKFGGSASTQNQSKFKAYEDGGAAGLIETMRNSSARSSFNAQVKASNKDGKTGIDYQIDYLNAVQKQDASMAKEMAAQASDYQKGTFTLQGNKWVYKDAKGKVTKTGTGASVTVDSEGKIPSVADYQGTKAESKTTVGSSTETIPSLKGGNDMSKYIAAHKNDSVKYSASSTVGASGYDYKDSDRFNRVKSLGKVGGVTMNGYNYEKAIKEIDTDGSGRESKAEITAWINKMADQNGWDQETKRKVYAAFAPKNYKNPY